jgi:hypothetical protein
MFRLQAVRSGTGGVAAALFLISLLYLALCMDMTVGPFDEGITLLGADRVLHGAVPHRDFYTLYGPGQFYVLAGLFKLFGASVLIERVWTIIACACCIGFIFLVVDRVAPRRFAVLGAIAGLPWFQNTHPYGGAIIPCMAAILAGLLFLTPVLGRGGRSPRLLGAGVCAGVAMLFRYDVGVAVFGSECLLLAISIWFERPVVPNRPRAILESLVVFGAGYLIVAVPLVIAYGTNGVFPDWFFDVVVFPADAYARTRGLPLPRLWVLRKAPTEFIGVYLPLVVFAAVVPAIMAAAGQRALQWTLLTLAVLELIWFGKGFVRATLAQMSMALVLCAPLAAMAAQPIRGRGRIGSAMAVAARVLCLGLIVATEPAALAPMVRNLTRPPDCHPPAGLERIACFEMSQATVETAQYVQQHTGPDDPVFVGLNRHDKIFINDMTLYFAMNRVPATKWYQFDPGLQTSAPIQREIIGELQRVRPKLVVLEEIWKNMNEPNESSVSSGVTLLDDYIRQSYEPVATFGVHTILRARTS